MLFRSLKTIGFDVPKEKYLMGNIQRNLMMADYLTSPSEYYTKKMLSAYHIDRLFSGQVLHSGYPRNSVFFDQALREKTRHDLGLLSHQVIIYMPTWRGAHASPQKGSKALPGQQKNCRALSRQSSNILLSA